MADLGRRDAGLGQGLGVTRRALELLVAASGFEHPVPQPLEDLGKVEMVRGPGSALYGANAFSGVVNITTPTAREALGTKLGLGGGELVLVSSGAIAAGLVAWSVLVTIHVRAVRGRSSAGSSPVRPTPS